MERETGTTQEIEKTFVKKVYDLVHELKDEIPFYPAANISGFNDEGAWEIRNELIRVSPDGVVQGLAGITTEKSWKIRESLINICPHSVARSLVGLEDKMAWQMRDDLYALIDRPGVANGLAESVAFLDDPRAWSLRRKLEKICPKNILEGLNGVDSPDAWILRKKYKKKYPMEVAASLIGLHDDKANRWRDEFLKQKQVEGVILSHMGSDTDTAWELREQYLDQYPFAVATSLAGLYDDEAWDIREKIKVKAAQNKDQEILKGLCQSLSPYMSAALKMRTAT